MKKTKKKKFLIVLHSGEKYEVEKESKKKLLSWLNTGTAGFLPIRSKNPIRFTQENIKEIIDISK